MPEKNIIDYYGQNIFLEKNALSKIANKKFEFSVGLNNLGATCFMNSVLQIFLNIPELTLYILSDQYNKDKKISDGIADAYKNLLLDYIKNNSIGREKLVKFRDEYAKIDQNYKINSPGDSVGFYMDFLNDLSSALNYYPVDNGEYKTLLQELGYDSEVIDKFQKKHRRIKKENNMFLERLFGFYYVFHACCTECGKYLSVNFDNDIMLKLDIDCSGYESLEDGIKLFKNSVRDRSSFCKKCNKEVQIKLKKRLLNMPNYFVASVGNGVSRIFDSQIGKKGALKFPIDDFSFGELALKKEDQNTKYELTSVLCHHGNSENPYAAHNYSYCKKSDGWYYFSDSAVKKMPDDFKINEDESIQNEVAFLVYKKKNIMDKDLFDGYNIKNFIDLKDERDLEIISELSKNNSTGYLTNKIDGNENQGQNTDNRNSKLEENENELSCDLENLLKMSKTLEELENNCIKVKDKKILFDESKKYLDEVFNKSRKVIFKKLGENKEDINRNLNNIKKELMIFVISSSLSQDEKSNYIELVKNANKISFLRRIWQTVKNIIMGRFSEVGKANQSIVFERISNIKKDVNTQNQR